jgi:hypothetical protein
MLLLWPWLDSKCGLSAPQEFASFLKRGYELLCLSVVPAFANRNGFESGIPITFLKTSRNLTELIRKGGKLRMTTSFPFPIVATSFVSTAIAILSASAEKETKVQQMAWNISHQQLTSHRSILKARIPGLLLDGLDLI